jgi:hypothetical protein
LVIGLRPRTAVVKHKIGAVVRSEGKAREELRTMARNEAERMGQASVFAA